MTQSEYVNLPWVYVPQIYVVLDPAQDRRVSWHEDLIDDVDHSVGHLVIRMDDLRVVDSKFLDIGQHSMYKNNSLFVDRYVIVTIDIAVAVIIIIIIS